MHAALLASVTEAASRPHARAQLRMDMITIVKAHTLDRPSADHPSDASVSTVATVARGERYDVTNLHYGLNH